MKKTTHILTILIFLFGYSIDKCCSQVSNEDLKEYIHQTYKYTFKYPERLKIKLFNNKNLQLTDTTKSIRSWISVNIEGDTYNKDQSKFKISYLDFIYKIGNRNFSADGPGGSMYCDSILNIEKQKNAHGIEYTKFDALVTGVKWNEIEPEFRDTSKYIHGPIYVIKLPYIPDTGNWRDRAMSIIGIPNIEIPATLIKTIIESFEFIE